MNDTTDKVRIQLDLTPGQARRFDELMRSAELGTRKELFNTAMTLFSWAVGEVAKGRRIASYDAAADRVETVLVPALETVARRAAEGASVGIEPRVVAVEDAGVGDREGGGPAARVRARG